MGAEVEGLVKAVLVVKWVEVGLLSEEESWIGGSLEESRVGSALRSGRLWRNMGGMSHFVRRRDRLELDDSVMVG